MAAKTVEQCVEALPGEDLAVDAVGDAGAAFAVKKWGAACESKLEKK